MSRRATAIGFLLAALLFWAGGERVWGQEGGVLLVSKYVGGELPTKDPDAEDWDSAPPLAIPLSSQVNFKPRIYDASVKSLTIRSLNNGREIVFLLEWEDKTRDDRTVRSESFSDGAAIQHPLNPEAPQWFCMGMPESVVNIWYWKAVWEKDPTGLEEVKAEYPAGGWDYYPFADEDTFYPGRVNSNFYSSPLRKTSVEDVNAARMQTLTTQPTEEQNVKGRGVWEDGRWRVIFSRSLISPDGHDAQFQPTKETGRLRPIAFAVWDGGNGERDGRKAVSTFYSLEIASPRGAFTYSVALGAGLLTAGLEVLLVLFFRRRKARQGGRSPG